MKANREIIKPILYMGLGAYNEFQKALKDINKPATNPFIFKWTIEKIEKLGFKLMQNDKLWCRFRGHGFDVLINLDTTKVKGNHFNFKAINLGGHFSAVIDTEAEFRTIIKCICKK